MRHTRLTRVTVGLAAGLVTASLLAACGSGEETEETAQPSPEETSSPAPTSDEDSESPTEETTEESTSSTRESENTTASERKDDEDEASSEILSQVEETFSSLAPSSLFEQFESCSESGIDGSYDCAGPDVGQFQFFDSDSKAASTTQLLTELRSSRVVEDTGRKVVGWSTLGTTAVITVVDNDEGLVMQQMVSSDQEDPEERIYELGLSEPDASTTTSRESEDENENASRINNA